MTRKTLRLVVLLALALAAAGTWWIAKNYGVERAVPLIATILAVCVAEAFRQRNERVKMLTSLREEVRDGYEHLNEAVVAEDWEESPKHLMRAMTTITLAIAITDQMDLPPQQPLLDWGAAVGDGAAAISHTDLAKRTPVALKTLLNDILARQNAAGLGLWLKALYRA